MYWTFMGDGISSGPPRKVGVIPPQGCIWGGHRTGGELWPPRCFTTFSRLFVAKRFHNSGLWRGALFGNTALSSLPRTIGGGGQVFGPLALCTTLISVGGVVPHTNGAGCGGTNHRCPLLPRQLGSSGGLSFVVRPPRGGVLRLDPF